MGQPRSGRTLLAASIELRKGQPLITCQVRDISDSGARLRVEDSGAIPDHFTLVLTGKTQLRRRCEVIERPPADLLVRIVE
jgi:hypothetical protein